MRLEDPLSLVFIGCFLFGLIFFFVLLLSGGAQGDADVDAGIDADVDAGVDADVDAGIDADVDAGIDADVDAGIDADVDAGIDADVDADVEVGDSARAPRARVDSRVWQGKQTVLRQNNTKSFLGHINLIDIVLFLLWFGFFGYAFRITTQLSPPITGMLALVCGVVLSRIILAFLKLVLPRPASTKLDFSNLEGRVAKVSISVPEGGVGEIIYTSPGGSRRSRTARSVDGRRFERGQEVVVVKIRRGIAVVKRRSPTR
jgi:membrane protein implicated in regulation of membrane protease activity